MEVSQTSLNYRPQRVEHYGS